MSLLVSPWTGPSIEVAPYRLSGTVYAALLNHRRSLEALGDAVGEPPYRGPPRQVVLAVKPRHALVLPGDPIRVDAAGEADVLEVGAALGIVIGRTACAVSEGEALAHVAGYLVVADCTVPRRTHFRPQIRAMARDASCVLGPRVVPAASIGSADALTLRTYVDGALVRTASTADQVRSAARLIADISDFMTLAPGDIVLTGSAPDAPPVRAGAHVAVEIDGIGRLDARVVAEAEARAA